MSVRVLIQQVMSAKLQLPPFEQEEKEYLDIGRGMVVYICCLQGVTEEKIRKAAQNVRKVKLSEIEDHSSDARTDGKRQSINDSKGDILVVPQATLGGKLKGNSVQYHNNIKPNEGETLYNLFCDELSEGVGGEVKRGIWGARQVVSMETNGPYSHMFDI